MIKVRIRPFISGSVDWFPPNIVIPGPESDVIWWIVTNFVVICAVTFFIMKRSILLFTTLFFLPETLNHLVVFDKAAVMTNVSPPLVSPRPIHFILSACINNGQQQRAPICCVARSKHSNWLSTDRSRQSH